jgi:hypothetical protein
MSRQAMRLSLPRNDSISGPPGKRDWNRVRSLFILGARFVPTLEEPGATSSEEEIAPQMLDVEAFIARSAPYSEKDGFFEKEIARAHRTIRAYRASLEHVRIASCRGRSRTVYARDQQYPALL